MRESELVLMTRAGPEIGVASTKAFTTQLAALRCSSFRWRGIAAPTPSASAASCTQLEHCPVLIEQTLKLDPRSAARERSPTRPCAVPRARRHVSDRAGRCAELKEISYIHAEAYAAGELKHGPLALVDEDMPVVAVAPNNDLPRSSSRT